MISSINFLKMDVYIQGVVFTINTFLFFMGFIVSVFWVYMMLLQFFIGVYQVCISGLGSILSKKLSRDIHLWRKIHIGGSLLYVTLLILFIEIFESHLGMILWFIIPQIIAYAYFLLTWKDYSSRKNYINQRPTVFSY